MHCLNCGSSNLSQVVDLVTAPPSNSYVSKSELIKPESWFKLCAVVCEKCWLVQVDHVVDSASIFNDDYKYFSSCSSSWVEHSKKYVENVSKKLSLTAKSTVVEVACNDGYLLQFFKDKELNFYGIEPTKCTADKAAEKGIKVIVDFFTAELAKSLVESNKSADLIIANNVLAHVPNIHDFLKAFKILLKQDGVITFEFPYLCNLVASSQFDTIYHEHYFYFSLTSLAPILLKHGLFMYDVEKIQTHGGSLRVYVCHEKSSFATRSDSLMQLIEEEFATNLKRLDYYHKVSSDAMKIKLDLLSFLISSKREGKKVVGYGAAAKGNTLLNYCGIKNDLIGFVADVNPAKQGFYLPGSRIDICSPEAIPQIKPDFILILPWNIADEIVSQLSFVRKWGCKFVVAVPELKVF